MKKTFQFTLCLIFFVNVFFAQNIGINGSGATAHASALLDVDAVSTPSLGVLIPRIALQAINSSTPVSGPATSLMLYNTSSAGSGTNAVTPGYYYWDGIKWVRFNTGVIVSSACGWLLNGNSGTTPGTDYLGTIDAKDLVFKTNNTEMWRIVNTTIPTWRANGNSLSISKTGIGLTSIGASNTATAGLLIGDNNTNSGGGPNTSLIGNGNNVASTSTVCFAFGNNNNFITKDTNCLSIGIANSMSMAVNCINIGNQSTGIRGSKFFTFGSNNAAVTGTNSFNIGNSLTGGTMVNSFNIGNGTSGFSGTNCYNIGNNNSGAGGLNSFYIGHNSIANTGVDCFSIGNNSSVHSSTNSVCIGNNSNINSVKNSFCIGNNVSVSLSNIMLLGGTGVNAVKVGIGLTSPTFVLDVAGTTQCTGNVWTSDKRKKQNIQTLKLRAIDVIQKLNPVTYEWKTVLDDGMKGTQMGFIAQELELVLPTMVVTSDDKEKSKAVKYNELLPIIVKAIQEQQQEIHKQKNEYEELQKELELLKKK